MTLRYAIATPLLAIAACAGPAYEPGIIVNDPDMRAELRARATLAPPGCTLRHRVHVRANGVTQSLTTMARFEPDGTLRIVGLGDFAETLFTGIRHAGGARQSSSRVRRMSGRILRQALLADFHSIFGRGAGTEASLQRRDDGRLALVDKRPHGRLSITLFDPESRKPQAWMRIRFLRCFWQASIEPDVELPTPIGSLPKSIRVIDHNLGYTSTLELLSAEPLDEGENTNAAG